MSVTVAIVAAVFGYRNLNGWKPVLLASGDWIGELKEPGVYVSTIFEVWNRRRYAIMVRGITVDFGKLKSTEFMLEHGFRVLSGRSLLLRASPAGVRV